MPVGHESGASAHASGGQRPDDGGSTSNPVVRFLARLASEFTAVLDLPVLLAHVMRSLHDELGFESASVALAEEGAGESRPAFVIRAGSGAREAHIGDVVPAGRGLHGVVAATGRPLHVPDLNADPRVFVRDPKMRSGIYAPLVVRGRVAGVLSAHRSTPFAFAGEDLDLLTVVAGYLAGAVEVARLYEQLKTAAATDMLTNLANRRAFFDRLRVEIARSQRGGGPCTVVLLDLNLLKMINDGFGHVTGDRALVEVARCIAGGIRASDLAARVGGDEFTLLLPGTTPEQAKALLERIAAAELCVHDERGIRVALRFAWGAAVCPDDGTTPDTLLHAADVRLYAMKAAGRANGPAAITFDKANWQSEG